MGYDERTIAPGMELWRNTGSAGPQRILPDGCMDLVLLGDQLVVAGPDTSARVHPGSTPDAVTGVRLHGGRGPLLLGVPADELRDRTVPLEDVWGSARARVMTEQVAEDPSTALATWATSSAAVDPFGDLVLSLLDVVTRWARWPTPWATALDSCTGDCCRCSATAPSTSDECSGWCEP